MLLSRHGVLKLCDFGFGAPLCAVSLCHLNDRTEHVTIQSHMASNFADTCLRHVSLIG
jgi:hypothetical protein